MSPLVASYDVHRNRTIGHAERTSHRTPADCNEAEMLSPGVSLIGGPASRPLGEPRRPMTRRAALASSCESVQSGLIANEKGRRMTIGIRRSISGSRAQTYDTFQGRIGAAAAEAGVEMQGPPQVEEFPVHETFAGR
jgi:hypothetical protein